LIGKRSRAIKECDLNNKVEKTVIMSGGGSGGHVVPALTVIKSLPTDVKIVYIGSEKGIERELTQQRVSEYFPIRTGKLRRYISIENLKDIFRVLMGIVDAFKCINKFPKSAVIFTFGGFVTVPVVVAGRLLGRKVFVHEQTTRVGLANRIAGFFATKVFVSFKSSLEFFSAKKVVYSGYPIRPEIYQAPKNVKIKNTDLNSVSRPILFITGGGNGAKLLNELVRNSLEELKKKYFIVHQVGKNFEAEYTKWEDENYKVFSFLGEEMIPLMKKAQIILSRSGAGTVAEIMSLKKRSIFIPLKIAQKNEQYHNAIEAQQLLGSLVVTEDQCKEKSLLEIISDFEKSSQKEIISNDVIDGREFMVSEILKCFE